MTQLKQSSLFSTIQRGLIIVGRPCQNVSGRFNIRLLHVQIKGPWFTNIQQLYKPQIINNFCGSFMNRCEHDFIYGQDKVPQVLEKKGLVLKAKLVGS